MASPENGAVYRADLPKPPSIFNSGVGTAESPSTIVAHRQAKVDQLINAYRVRGHTEADIDPLGRRRVTPHPELTLDYYGLTEQDLDCKVSGQSLFGVPESPRFDILLKDYERPTVAALVLSL